MIKVNCNPTLKLPYIYIPEIDAKLMLDTGSTKSFLSPKVAYKFFRNYIFNEPFTVVSTHASSVHNEVLEIPLFPTFCSNDYHKFYIFNVDSDYEGLIGNDLLKQLEAMIDLKNLVLHTQHVQIPIVTQSIHRFIIPPRSELKVNLPVDQYNGDAILNYQKFTDGLRMPSALVNCTKGYANTIIQNSTNTEYILTIKSPMRVEKYIAEEIEINHIHHTLSDTEIDNLLLENLDKIRLDHVNQEESKEIYALCQEYKDIFYCDQLPLSFTNSVKHEIRTTNEDPIFVRPYRQAPIQTLEINKQVEKLLENNVVQESHSPWNAPVHLVPKKMDASGETKFRMVIDYRRLNEITVDDKYPLPNINDLFDKLGKSVYFSTIDLASGYHQIEVEKRDRQKTAFSTQNGHYEFVRMPFGLKTAPATFQRTMDNVLRGLQGLHCMVYLDDVIIYSSSLKEHMIKLKLVFERLRATNLKIQLDKSEFLRKEVLYLGHTITKEGLKPNDDKIKAVLEFPIPKTTTEIKSFLGLVGYYRRFIKDFAKITQPLTSCLKKRNKIIIDQKYVDAFNKCKELLTHAPLLQYPDFNEKFILTTDASNVALGAVLSQGKIGSDKPIAYASRTLSDTESRYSTIERELLAIIWATKHFRPYLYGKKFYIYTDHRPLAWLNSLKDPNSKLTRWRLRLQDFDFEIIYKNGKQNTNADALSRIKLNALNDDQDGQSMVVNVDRKENSNSSTVTISDKSKTISAITISDSSESGKSLESNFPIRTPSEPSNNSQTIHSALDLESLGIPILREAIDTKPNQILVFFWHKNETQVNHFNRDKQKVIEVFLPLDNTDLIKNFLKEYIRPKLKYFIYFEHSEHRRLFSNIVISLFKKDTIQLFECTERVVYVEDENEQKAVILKHHEGITCHRGIKETLTHIRRNYYWNNMQETISAVINACEACKKMKYDRKPLKPVLQLTQTQEAPFQEIFIDLFSIESKYYLTLIDAFSKLGQCLEISNKSTPEVVRALMKYFSFYGTPKKISADPGTEFNNDLMREFLALHKIDLHIGTPNNPNSMGLIERFHSTIIEIYRLAKYEKKCTDAASVMTYSVMAYNHTIHSATGLTPFEVVFGHTDSNNPYEINFEKTYMQQLVKDHAKRTKFLYQYLAENLKTNKERIQQKRGGESNIQIETGKTVYVKGGNKRKSKDKARYEKGKVAGPVDKNIVPLEVSGRVTKAPIKNIKRPSQVVSDRDRDAGAGPSSAIP